MNEHSLLGAGLGAIIGAILALTGAGGGILAVPLLVFGLGLSMVEAAPIGLLAVGLAASVGAVLGLRQGIVRYRAAGFVASIGILMAPLGLWLAHRLPNLPLALLFSLVLLYACGRILRKAQPGVETGPGGAASGVPALRAQPGPGSPALDPALRPRPDLHRHALGPAVGVARRGRRLRHHPGPRSRYTNLDSKSIVATSLAVIALVSLGSVITASLSGVMHWAVGAPFALGAVAGLVLGRQVASHLAGPRLQQLFAVTGLLAALLLAGGALGWLPH